MSDPPVTGARSVHVRISGRVQGVGFRAWAKRRADALGLSGWIRNESNGDVEAVFSGPGEAVEAMIAACQDGPRHAEVARVEILGAAAMRAGAFVARG